MTRLTIAADIYRECNLRDYGRQRRLSRREHLPVIAYILAIADDMALAREMCQLRE